MTSSRIYQQRFYLLFTCTLDFAHVLKNMHVNRKFHCENFYSRPKSSNFKNRYDYALSSRTFIRNVTSQNSAYVGQLHETSM